MLLIAQAVWTGVPEPQVVEGMPAILALNRWRPVWLVAFGQVTHPKALTRLAWLSEITLLLNRTGGVPGVTSVIGLDEVPGLDAGGDWPPGMPVRAGFQPVPATKGQLLFI